MATRTTMSALITLVRQMIFEPSATEGSWADEDLQRWLDLHVELIDMAPLGYVWEMVGGVRGVFEYVSSRQYWESNALLTDAARNPVTPSAADPLAGRWSFTTHQPPPLYVTGRTYDVYAAAADAVEARLARRALEYDFSADGSTFHRSQAYEAMRDLVKTLRARSRPMTARMIRSDTT